MTSEGIQKLLLLGENIAIEFKRCGNGIDADTYESVCSMLNRFGGDILLGVEDDGTVVGLPPNAAPDMARNFISCISNPAFISPTVYLMPDILEYEGKTIIHVHVPMDGEIHSYKGVIYDRVADADVKLKSSDQIAELSIRKRNIFTEQWLYPNVKLEDLRLDMIPKLQQMAVNMTVGGNHPWKGLSPVEVLKSAGLYVENLDTGKYCPNLAAIMLLGRDEVIFDTNPTYKTDALLRKVNVDRYDDRLTVQTNLIDSFDALLGFAAKHMLDKFFLEDGKRVSLAAIIAREMISNTLIHREYSSHYIAKFIIMKDKMVVENACRARRDREITPENLEPDSKNPRIAAFFKNLYLVDELGSGTRKLFKYVPFYSNAKPVLHEADIFRIIVPLDDDYSFDARIAEPSVNTPEQNNGGEVSKNSGEVSGEVSKNSGAVEGENSGAVEGENSGAVKENSGAVKENSGAVKENSGAVKKNDGAVEGENSGTVSKPVKKLLLSLREAHGITELSIQLNIRSRSYIRAKMLAPAMRASLIELEQPDSLHSPTQKYRLTEKGRLAVQNMDQLENTGRKRKNPPK